MSRISFLISYAVASLLLVTSARAAEATATVPSDEAAIRKTADDFTKAFNAGQAENVAQLWTEDGEYVIGETRVAGRAAIAKLYSDFFTTNPGAAMKVNVRSVKLLAPTVALEEGTAAVENSNGSSTTSPYTAIHVKRNGKWQMVSVREAEMPAQTPTANLNELEWLIGKWKVVGTGGKVDVSCQWFGNRHFIRCESNIRGDGDAPAVATQVIGVDPLSGHLVSWFFDTEGGHGYGVWMKNGSRWVIESQGATVDGATTTAVNVLYHPEADVASWKSVERTRGGMSLPDAKEVVIERMTENK